MKEGTHIIFIQPGPLFLLRRSPLPPLPSSLNFDASVLLVVVEFPELHSPTPSEGLLFSSELIYMRSASRVLLTPEFHITFAGAEVQGEDRE